ncbi:MAG TPA: hypothetical protein VGF11_04590 [Acidimicrobiales bacterium]
MSARRTVVCPELGLLDNPILEDRETPAAGESQEVVQVRAAGVNDVDGLMGQGRYLVP